MSRKITLYESDGKTKLKKKFNEFLKEINTPEPTCEFCGLPKTECIGGCYNY